MLSQSRIKNVAVVALASFIAAVISAAFPDTLAKSIEPLSWLIPPEWFFSAPRSTIWKLFSLSIVEAR